MTCQAPASLSTLCCMCHHAMYASAGPNDRQCHRARPQRLSPGHPHSNGVYPGQWHLPWPPASCHEGRCRPRGRHEHPYWSQHQRPLAWLHCGECWPHSALPLVTLNTCLRSRACNLYLQEGTPWADGTAMVNSVSQRKHVLHWAKLCTCGISTTPRDVPVSNNHVVSPRFLPVSYYGWPGPNPHFPGHQGRHLLVSQAALPDQLTSGSRHLGFPLPSARVNVSSIHSKVHPYTFTCAATTATVVLRRSTACREHSSWMTLPTPLRE